MCGGKAAAQPLLHLYFSDTLFVEPGVEFSFDLRADGFQQMAAASFSIQWDSAYIHMIEAAPLALMNGAFVNPGDTAVAVAWSSFSGLGLDLPDSASLLRLRCMGMANQPVVTRVRIAAQPLGVEFYQWQNGNLAGLPVEWIDQIVVIRSCSTAVELGMPIADLCAGDTLALQPVFTHADGWVWHDASVASTYTTTDSGWVKVWAWGAFRCESADSTWVAVHPTPQLTLTATLHHGFAIACFGQNTGEIQAITLADSPAFIWNDGATTAGRTQLIAGFYAVTLTDAHTCTQTAAINLSAPPPLQLQLEGPEQICFDSEDGYLQLTNMAGGVGPYQVDVLSVGTYEDLSGPDFRIDDLAAGEYAVTMSDQNGCQTPELIWIVESGAPVLIDLPAEYLIMSGDSVQLQADISASAPFQAYWAPGVDLQMADSVSVWASPTETTAYQLTVVDAEGCVGTASTVVEVRRPVAVYVPNAICPPAEQSINQRLKAFVSGGATPMQSLKVYDRWGNCIYDQKERPLDDSQTGWGGEARGKMAAPGVYVYVLTLKWPDGDFRTFQGDVFLMLDF